MWGLGVDVPSLDHNGHQDPVTWGTAVASLVSFSGHDPVRGQMAKVATESTWLGEYSSEKKQAGYFSPRWRAMPLITPPGIFPGTRNIEPREARVKTGE